MKAMRIVSIVLALLVVLVSVGVGQASMTQAQPRDKKPPGTAPAPSREIIADRDGNRIFDNLEARLAGVGDDHQVPVIVLFNQPLSQVDLAAMQRQLGSFAVRYRYETISGIATTWTKGQVLAASRLPIVKQVEYDAPVQAVLETANEWFGVNAARSAWGVTGNADGQASYSKNDVVIAVVDTGIDAGHVDLDGGKIIGWHDVINGQLSPYDDHGHGTHVASIAAGEGQGNAAYQGVAPGAALVGVKVLNSSGSGTISQVIAGIEWAITNRTTYGIQVMNVSLGGPGSSDGKDSLSQALDSAADAGIVPVVAAGNSGPWSKTIGSGAAAAKALTVGAMADVMADPSTGSYGFALAGFSSRGPTADGRIKPDIASPGVAIMAAKVGTTTGYFAQSGTSMATPFMAGVAALMLQRNSSLTPEQVKTLTKETAVDWGPAGGDNEYGAGRLDALAAIKAAASTAISPTGPNVPPHAFLKGRLGNEGDYVFHDLYVSDASQPLALTLIVPDAVCTLDYSFIGLGCWASSPDFDIELYDPNGVFIAESILLDRQDTITIMPKMTGRYRTRIYVCTGCDGRADYWLDISGATTQPPPSSTTWVSSDLEPKTFSAKGETSTPTFTSKTYDPKGQPAGTAIKARVVVHVKAYQSDGNSGAPYVAAEALSGSGAVSQVGDQVTLTGTGDLIFETTDATELGYLTGSTAGELRIVVGNLTKNGRKGDRVDIDVVRLEITYQ